MPHTTAPAVVPVTTTAEVRAALLARREIALLDVREEAPFAEAHPLFAANLALSRIELEAWRRIPRRDVPIVVYDDDNGRGEGLARRAAERLAGLGYTRVSLLDGGLAGWAAAGGELFRDVNVPSKAFGELVEAERHTPSFSAQEVQALLDQQRAGKANMTASWLAQMGWEVFVVDKLRGEDFTEAGPVPAQLPPVAEPRWVRPAQLAQWLAEPDGEHTVVLNVTPSASHVQRHIPGAWSAVRAQLPALLARWPGVERLVLTCGSGLLARYAAADLSALDLAAEVCVLEGGNAGWVAAGLPTEAGAQRMASGRIDRYRRPYEGTDNPAAAMQAYLDWEFGLVAQLGRDGTHGFAVL